MKTNFLPDNNITATTLDEIFLSSETAIDEYRIRKSLLRNFDGDILDGILIHAKRESEVGFCMSLYSKIESDDPIYKFYMGTDLPQWLLEEISEHYTITLIP